MTKDELFRFVNSRGCGVVATQSATGDPEAAIVGLAATDRAELIFDTSRTSRKFVNLSAHPRVAVVVGWEDELTLQLEGDAEVLEGPDAEVLEGADAQRCREAYFDLFPDGRERAMDEQIVHVRIRPFWSRYSDFRPGSFSIAETDWTHLHAI